MASLTLSGEDPITALGIVAAGIAGAAAWNIVTWRFAIPSSFTHALVGGLVGVTVVVAGPGDVSWGLWALADGQLEGVTKIVVALVLSPIVGVVAGFRGVPHRPPGSRTAPRDAARQPPPATHAGRGYRPAGLRPWR